jgi:predicted nucleic acid-binding protein
MSTIDPLAKMLGEGVVEMRRKLDAAEGRADELQRQLAVAHEVLRGAREALSEAADQVEHDTWETMEVLDTISASLREIAEVLP